LPPAKNSRLAGVFAPAAVVVRRAISPASRSARISNSPSPSSFSTATRSSASKE
jgi:hypothetical protein